jgi:GDP-4-dehydro-6-deoxy-D-mannose reductase
VTGAHGFVGRHLLTELGDGAAGLDADVLDAEALRTCTAVSHPDAVVHLAARSSVTESWRSSPRVWNVNVIGTVNVLAAVSAESPMARVLVASSADVYGRAASMPTPEQGEVAPVSPYGASKAAAEVACGLARRRDNLDVVVVRPFTHIGPGQGEAFAVGSWAHQIARAEAAGGGSVRVGDLMVRRDLTDVRDICRAYAALLDPAVPRDVYNVASGRSTPMRDILDILMSFSSVSVNVVEDAALLRTTDIPAQCGDASLLRKATGWEPQITLEQTLRDVLEDARVDVGPAKVVDV